MKRLLFFCLILAAPTLLAKAKLYCVTDDANRLVCLKAPARRIISLAPSLTELSFSAGAGDYLIAVEGHSDYPQQARSLPKVGNYPNISLEALVAMQPDLILLSTGYSQLAEQLNSLGLAYFVSNPQNLQAIAKNVQSIGQLADTSSEAEKRIEKWQFQLKELKATYSRKKNQSVIWVLWGQPLIVAGGKSLLNQIITLCGATNRFAQIKAPSTVISKDDLLTKEPLVIVSQSSQNLKSLKELWQDFDPQQKPQFIDLSDQFVARPSFRILAGAASLCRFLATTRSHTNTK